MKQLLLIVGLSFQIFCFAITNQNEKLINKIESEYQINIYDKVNIDFFLYYWQDSPMNLSAQNIDKEDELLILKCLSEVLQEYPKLLVSNTIRNVYLIGNLSKKDLPEIFSYNQSIYISASKNHTIVKDSVTESINKEFIKIFFNYFPLYNNNSERIDNEIKERFIINNINRKALKRINKLSSDYGVHIKLQTCPGDIPIPFRQRPYSYYSNGSIDYISDKLLNTIDSTLSQYPEFIKSLVNNIYLFKLITSNNNEVPSFSYYSDIYLSIYKSDGTIDYSLFAKQLQFQLSTIIYQNLIADIPINKWISFNNSLSNINPYQEIESYVSILFSNKDSLELLALKDSIANKKILYLKGKYDRLISKINKIDTNANDSLAMDLNKKYGITFHYNFKFPLQTNNNEIITAGLSILSNPNPYQLQRALLNVDTALNVYPKELLVKYLKNIWIVETMQYGKSITSPGGTFSYFNKAVYLSNVGNYNESLQMAFHHEFSSLVRKFSGTEFPKEKWLLINDTNFSYSMDKYYNPSRMFSQAELNQDGFLELYSTSLIDNDIEVFTSWLFDKPKELAVIANENVKIRMKLIILYDYYRKIIPEYTFCKEIETSLKMIYKD